MDPREGLESSATGNALSPELQRCPACTYDENGPNALVCLVCGAVLPDTIDADQSLWICGQCTTNNPESAEKCKICQNKRYPHLPSENELLGAANSVDIPSADEPKTPSSPSQRPAFNRQTSSLTDFNREKHGLKMSLKVNDIVKFCAETNTKFEDPEFPPLHMSIFSERMHSNRPLTLEGGSKVTQWLRPNNIYVKGSDSKLDWTLFNNPTATDIVQGCLGNCWFASALSVVAENRTLLERIFVTKQYNPMGVYAMRLCKDGRWIDVFVDDNLPCLPNGSLAFCKAKRKQLWVPLIEKALAKVYGSYGALVSGTTQEGLATLTGFSCESFDTESIKGMEEVQAGEGADLLWARLLSSVESGLLLGCSCGKSNISSEEFTRVGLVSNHAYSVLDVQLVHGERLLHLRNTWGAFSWTGNWSEHSDSWKVIPAEIRTRLITKGSSEGMFWISFNDWLKYFSAVYIGFVREGWHEARVHNRFQTGHDSMLNISRLCILERTEVDISLHQQSSRGESSYDIVDLVLLVFDDNWRLVLHSKRVLRNHTTCSTVLQPGYYNIFCLSFTHWLSEVGREYTIACHSHQPVFLEQISLPRETTAEALLYLALSQGNATICDDEGLMCTYTLCRGWSGQIMIVVNNNPTKYLHIKNDMTESMNLVSTRGLSTIDVVPPLHRQVLNISTHLECTSSFSMRSRQKFVITRSALPIEWGINTRHEPQITSQLYPLHRQIPFLYS